jgi:ABC-type branched-subunit amino acid transport system substrate-binding protein
MRRNHYRVLTVAVASLSILLPGCRSGDDGGDGAAAPGVTSEACPDAVNPDNGCIYLGTLSDLTVGPFAPLAVPITDAQEAFWNRVNEDGGIGGYDINVTEYVRDNQYNPQLHNQLYQEIKGDVLALAQTLGSPTTAAIIEDLAAESIVAAPASWTSLWAYEDVIVESGTNYCFEAMNSVDWAVEERDVQSVMAVYYPGDYGEDGAAGAKVAAEAHGLDFSAVETEPGEENQTAAINEIVQQDPDLVVLTTAPVEAATVIGETAARGYQGLFIGTSPTWNPSLMTSPAAEAIQALYLQSAPWAPFTADTPGHQAMREALGDVDANDGYTAGWAWSYPLKAALEAAAENDDLTREGLLEAVQGLESVDYEGMLPPEAGNFAADPNEGTYRGSVLNQPDPDAPSGVSPLEEFFVGPTAEGYAFEGACYQEVDLG